MTVKELISKLEEMPQEMLVYDDGSYEPIEDIFIDRAYINNKDDLTDVVFIR